MKAPERFETARFLLRKPVADDAEEIYARYAGDPEVTRFMGWPRHLSSAETRAFLAFSDAEWERWPGGPYLIESRDSGRLLGSTGFTFESPSLSATGYVLARDAWGKGYATEALNAVVEIAEGLGGVRLYAICHPDHAASVRVLEKCGFRFERRLEEFQEFPNLNPGVRQDCLRFALGEGE